MLAPLAEATSPGPFVDFALAGLRYYPEFLQMLAEDCGDAPVITGPGMLRLAFSLEAVAVLQQFTSLYSSCGLPYEWLDSGRVLEQCPDVSGDVKAAIFSPLERHVPTPALVRALYEACVTRNVTFFQNTVIASAKTRSTGLALAASNLSIECGQVVLAAGSWSREVGDVLGGHIPVSPLKGQILRLGPALPLPFHCTLTANHVYLVPRPNGQIVVGATEEDVGFHTGHTAAGVAYLVNEAVKIAPCLGQVGIESMLVGFRPSTPDKLPIIGWSAHSPRVYVATGHRRNGILLAPITSLVAQREICGQPCDIDVNAFRPQRFSESG
jgi:glycine oxidase